MMDEHPTAVWKDTTQILSSAVSNESFENFDDDPGINIVQSTSILYLVLYVALIVAVILGNSLVLLAIYYERSLRTPTNYFIANLACADLLLGTLVLPFSCVIEVTEQWFFGQVFCDVWVVTDVLCCTASITSLCVISIDRYIGVTLPLKHRLIMTSRRAAWLNVLVWVLSLSIAVGPLLGWRPPKDDPMHCPLSDQIDYVIFSALGSFYIPMAIIVVLYIKIYSEVRKESKKLRTRGGNGTHPDSDQVTLRIHRGTLDRSYKSEQYVSGGEESNSSDNMKSRSTRQSLVQRRVSHFNREKQVAKVLGIVVGAFVVCWFPFFFLLPLTSLHPDSKIPPGVFTFAFWLGYCNSFVNPIIYGASNRRFRSAFKGILTCRYCCGKRRRLYYVSKMISNRM